MSRRRSHEPWPTTDDQRTGRRQARSQRTGSRCTTGQARPAKHDGANTTGQARWPNALRGAEHWGPSTAGRARRTSEPAANPPGAWAPCGSLSIRRSSRVSRASSAMEGHVRSEITSERHTLILRPQHGAEGPNGPGLQTHRQRTLRCRREAANRSGAAAVHRRRSGVGHLPRRRCWPRPIFLASSERAAA